MYRQQWEYLHRRVVSSVRRATGICSSCSLHESGRLLFLLLQPFFIRSSCVTFLRWPVVCVCFIIFHFVNLFFIFFFLCVLRRGEWLVQGGWLWHCQLWADGNIVAMGYYQDMLHSRTKATYIHTNARHGSSRQWCMAWCLGEWGGRGSRKQQANGPGFFFVMLCPRFLILNWGQERRSLRTPSCGRLPALTCSCYSFLKLRGCRHCSVAFLIRVLLSRLVFSLTF